MYISKQVSDEVILLFPNTKCCLLTFNSFYSSFNVVEVILICFLIHDEIILKILQQTFSLNLPWKNCHVKIFWGKSLYLHCFLKNREAAYFLPPPRWVALVQNICWCLPYQSAKVIKLENNLSKTTEWPCDQHSWSFLSKRNGEMLPLRYGILP